jgi:hypothetical protein
MDNRTTSAVETTLQTELLYNERIIQHPTFGAVKLARATPRQESLIAEARRKQTHKDMRDPDVLSRDQLEKLAVEKGMWTPGLTERITELTHKTGEAMGLLEFIGFKSFEDVLQDFQNVVKKLLDLYADDEPMQKMISEYFDLDGTPNLIDRTKIIDNAVGSVVDDLMDQGDQVRSQLDLLKEMFKVRKELNELQQRQSRVFLDSLENRADRAEELAILYHCIKDATTGKPLWPTYEEIWDARPEDIEILMTEYHYFRHGITDEFKETLGKYGFIKRLTDTSDSPDDSPAQPQSNSGGESVEPTPSASSEATA